jgi:hypothetical protein
MSGARGEDALERKVGAGGAPEETGGVRGRGGLAGPWAWPSKAGGLLCLFSLSKYFLKIRKGNDRKGFWTMF